MKDATFNEAHDAAHSGKAFSVYTEFHGPNSTNLSGRSDKFWMIERAMNGGHIRIRYGKTGSFGSVTLEGISAYEAFNRLYDKRAKGYQIHKAQVAPRASISELGGIFGQIRSIVADPTDANLFVARDELGSVLCHLPYETAQQILDTYDL